MRLGEGDISVEWREHKPGSNGLEGVQIQILNQVSKQNPLPPSTTAPTTLTILAFALLFTPPVDLIVKSRPLSLSLSLYHGKGLTLFFFNSASRMVRSLE